MAKILQGVLHPGQLIALGLAGSEFISDTDPHTAGGPWWKVVCRENTVFATLTDSLRDETNGNTLAGTFPAGFELYGNFTAIDLTSGAVIAYKFPSDQNV